MQKVGFEEAIEEIAASDSRFDRNAYFFLRGVLDETVKNLGRDANLEPGRHVSGPELLEGFRRHALDQFGPMTTTVLEEWGVTKCSDVGAMVFNLIDAGVFGQSEDDRPEDFENGYDFHDAFVRPFLPRQKPKFGSAPGSPQQHQAP